LFGQTAYLRIGGVALLLALLLAGCATGPRRSEPKPGVNVDLIPEPKPRAEPRSKYGNPESYVEGGVRYWVIPNPKGFVERGQASWYGKEFDGKRTSSGETYNMYDMTAAHRTLPLPTYIEVRSLKNNRKVIVRVNDRGPFAKNRILDLSYAAASKLGMIGEGTTPVEIRVLDPADYQPAPKQSAVTVAAAPLEAPPQARKLPAQKTPASEPTGGKPGDADDGAPGIYVQVGAYARSESAEAVKRDVGEALNKPVLIAPIESAIGVLYRVRLGPFASEAEARKVLPGLRDRGYFQYRIVRQ